MKLLMRFIIASMMLTNLQIVNAELVEKLDGVWVGEGRQSSSASSKQWTIRFTAKNGVYLIEYPSLTCGGTWTFLSETSGSVTFFEDIQVGTSRCVDGGTVELLLIENNKLRYTCYLPNGNIDAFGELECLSCNINANNATFNNGVLHIPNVDVLDGFGGFVTYEANLSFVPSSGTFELTDVHKK